MNMKNKSAEREEDARGFSCLTVSSKEHFMSGPVS